MKKHIVCFGDSNTYGSCGDPRETDEETKRFNEAERWTCLLQKALGDDFLIIEEGMSGRTAVSPDPLTEGIPGIDVIFPILMSPRPVDLLILMLGTNDTKDRFGLNAACIAKGMERLINKAIGVPCWGNSGPNILVICPPHIGEGMIDSPIGPIMGEHCAEKSKDIAKYLEPAAKALGCCFLDAEGIAEVNRVDFTHLSKRGHRQLAEKLAAIVPAML